MDLFSHLELPRKQLRADIADGIQGLIASSKLQVGDKLPSERDLAKALGVGRPSVREAIRLLEQRGLLEMRPRSGIYIAQIKPDQVAGSIERHLLFGGVSPSSILELREALEPKAAAMAAERATEEDLDRLEAAVAALEETASTGGHAPHAEAHVVFHEEVASASHNELFIAISQGLHRVMRALMRQEYTTPIAVVDGLSTHRLVYEGIRARDAMRAEAAMVLHMTIARSLVAPHLRAAGAGREAAEMRSSDVQSVPLSPGRQASGRGDTKESQPP